MKYTIKNIEMIFFCTWSLKRDNKGKDQRKKEFNNEKGLKYLLRDIAVYFKLSFLKSIIYRDQKLH